MAQLPAPPLELSLVEVAKKSPAKSEPTPVFEPKLVIVLVASVVNESSFPTPRTWNLTTPRGLPSSTIDSARDRISVLLLDTGHKGEM